MAAAPQSGDYVMVKKPSAEAAVEPNEVAQRESIKTGPTFLSGFQHDVLDVLSNMADCCDVTGKPVLKLTKCMQKKYLFCNVAHVRGALKELVENNQVTKVPAHFIVNAKHCPAAKPAAADEVKHDTQAPKQQPPAATAPIADEVKHEAQASKQPQTGFAIPAVPFDLKKPLPFSVKKALDLSFSKFHELKSVPDKQLSEMVSALPSIDDLRYLADQRREEIQKGLLEYIARKIQSAIEESGAYYTEITVSTYQINAMEDLWAQQQDNHSLKPLHSLKPFLKHSFNLDRNSSQSYNVTW